MAMIYSCNSGHYLNRCCNESWLGLPVFREAEKTHWARYVGWLLTIWYHDCSVLSIPKCQCHKQLLLFFLFWFCCPPCTNEPTHSCSWTELPRFAFLTVDRRPFLLCWCFVLFPVTMLLRHLGKPPCYSLRLLGRPASRAVNSPAVRPAALPWLPVTVQLLQNRNITSSSLTEALRTPSPVTNFFQPNRCYFSSGIRSISKNCVWKKKKKRKAIKT